MTPFQKRLVDCRIQARLSQRALAKLARVSCSAVARIESEKEYRISWPMITALAHALKVSPEWLETGADGEAMLAAVSKLSAEYDRRVASIDERRTA